MSQVPPVFSEYDFFRFIRHWGAKLGKELLTLAFTLYEMWEDPDVPTKAKVVIASALAYLLLPVDAVPDMIPVIGFADDLTALAAAMSQVSEHVKPKHRARAEARVRSIFE